jgi:NADH:ubiquinone oxidoreductase subunit B-like Fe-S oxidoreductase
MKRGRPRGIYEYTYGRMSKQAAQNIDIYSKVLGIHKYGFIDNCINMYINSLPPEVRALAEELKEIQNKIEKQKREKKTKDEQTLLLNEEE